MPKTSKTQYVYQDFNASPNTSQVDSADGAYEFLQNVRGWSNFGSKRRGVQQLIEYSTSVMGIFDCKVDGDADSLDKIMVYLRDGSLVFYDWGEVSGEYGYLFDTCSIIMQSPAGLWYELGIDTDGMISTTEVATPASYESVDYTLGEGNTMGFKLSAAQSFQFYWDESDSDSPVWATKETYTIPGAITYLADQAFANGYGFVFTDSSLIKRRLTVENGGILGSVII